MDSNTKNILWNTAGIAGLLLGLTSTSSMFIGQYLSTLQLSTVMNTLLGLIVWLIETVGCIFIMISFMKKFVTKCPSADNSMTLKMGIATALLSALIYAAATFANMAYLSADYYNNSYQTLLQQMSSALDSNTMEQMEKMLSNMPQITFFSNLIYCFIYGTILSVILSRNIPAKDPFADYKPEEQ